MNPLVRLSSVSFHYVAGREILCDINADFFAAQSLAVVGPSGCGKSTLFRLLNGIAQPQKGEILFNGQKVSKKQAFVNEWRAAVGVVGQEPDNQLFCPRVLDELVFAPRNLGLSAKESENRARKILEQLGISELASEPPHCLSFGQKKRVAIASVLAMHPQILVLDEPTAGLDAANAHLLMELLDSLRNTGMGIVYSTHDEQLAVQYSQRVLAMNQGSVIKQGLPWEVFADAGVRKACGFSLPTSYLIAESLGIEPVQWPASIAEAIALVKNNTNTSK